MTFYTLLLPSVSFFPPRGPCLSTLSMIFWDWYLVNSCLRATSLLNEIFRKSSNFENFVDHRVPLHYFAGIFAKKVLLSAQKIHLIRTCFMVFKFCVRTSVRYFPFSYKNMGGKSKLKIKEACEFCLKKTHNKQLN